MYTLYNVLSDWKGISRINAFQQKKQITGTNTVTNRHSEIEQQACDHNMKHNMKHKRFIPSV